MKKQKQQIPNQAEARRRLRSTFDGLYKSLNTEQRQAVDAIEGPVMVLAGPGTGKTQVLTMRIANILRRTDADASSILCLTFTESAAAAMRERLVMIIGNDAFKIRISTFHAFCNDVIQENPEKFSLAREWQSLSEAERVEVVQGLIDELPGTSPLKPFGSPYLFLPDIIGSLQSLKKEGVTPVKLKNLVHGSQKLSHEIGELVMSLGQLSATERTAAVTNDFIRQIKNVQVNSKAGEAVWYQVNEIISDYISLEQAALNKREAGKARTLFKNRLKKLVEKINKQTPRQLDLIKIYKRYQGRLQSMGRYDFEDMIMQVAAALQYDDELLAENQERWQYILVDEYQDTNGAQNEVINLMSSWHDAPNVFVVGDDKQSIFRFQGASLENLLSFWRRHKDNVEVISLKMNYRSQQLILDAAGKLISNNRETVTRYIPEVQATLRAAKEYKESKIDLVKYPTNDEEEYEVALRVKKLIDNGVKPEQIAVLGRYNRDVDEMADRLSRMGVSVRIESGINALREMRVRQFKKLLEWVVDSLNEEAAADVLQYDWWSFKPLDVLKLLYFAGRRGKGILATATNLGSLQEAGVEQPELFIEWAKQVAKWKRLAANIPLINLFDELLHDTGLLMHLEHDSNGIRELKALNALFSELKRMSLAKPDLTLKEFIARLSLMDENNLALTTEVVSASSRAVRIMTAHKAKGLEFDYVFMVRLVDRHWGNQRSRTRLALPAGIVKFDPVLEQENNEDERRLFYVALTRAKRQLVWSYAQFDDKGREQLPSLFLNEVGSDFIEDTFVTSEGKVKKRLMQMRTKKVIGMEAEDIREWAKEQLKKYVMSVTHLNNYLECPRMFYYRNFLRLPAAKNKHMAFGTAVHAALFDLWQTTKQDRDKVGKKYLFDRFKRHLQREVLSSKDRQDCLEIGQKVLQQYFEYYGIPSAKKYELEYSFRRHGVAVDDLQLTGQLDRIEYLPDNKVKVIDYKTGNPDSAYKESRPGGKYHRQLVFYKLLCDQSRRFNQIMVSGELDFIQPSIRQGKFIRMEYQVGAEEVDKIKETIRQVWSDIKSLRFMSWESGCRQCDYCLAEEQRRTGGS